MLYRNSVENILKIKVIAVMAVVLIVCSGCSFSSLLSYFKKSEPVRSTPEAMYALGTQEYQDGRYKKAREYYTRLKEEHPLHDLAILAELGIADAYYSDKDYPEAEAAYSDFISLYPTHEQVPYAIYQLGMCHFVQMGAIDRDQTETIQAKREFDRLMARYPQSKFVALAEEKNQECKKNLAEHEYYIGNFYFKQKKYEAALKRFETILRDYAGVGLDEEVRKRISQTKERLARQAEKAKSKEK